LQDLSQSGIAQNTQAMINPIGNLPFRSRLIGLLFSAAAWALPLRAQLPSSDAPDLDFLLGSWFIEEMGLIETWEKASPGYLGKAVTRADGRLFEGFDVGMQGDRWYYNVTPAGQDPASFLMMEYSPGKVVFHRDESDMPSTITYYLEGEVRKVRLQGKEGEQELDMVFELKPLSGQTGAAGAGLGSALGTYAQLTLFTPRLEENKQFFEQLGLVMVGGDNAPVPWVLLSDGAFTLQLMEHKTPLISLQYYSDNASQRAENLVSSGMVLDAQSRLAHAPHVLMGPDSLLLLALVQGAPPRLPARSAREGALGIMGELALPVGNLEEAASWYSKLGFREQGMQRQPYPWAIYSDGMVTLGFHQTDAFKQPSLTFFSLESAKKLEALRQAGLEVKPLPGAKGDGKNGVLYSPDGWPVQLFYGTL
jgi:hypothetical protein